ncbi:putative nucleoside transporter [Hypoxylon trugodes]|uniref:putative nucleoside transporter n=1 Tax=Hypoxylon trugodes TaxID=326681 RepID=UPI00219C4378|nr:putative nucleoside transporter [Hypoxylon trugodes]KAI1389408.1 putative nucleoside transporter [Hypoxylon trugodes]
MNRVTNDEEKNEQSISGIEIDSSSENILESSRDAPKTGLLERLRGWEQALDRRLGVESHSIQRKLPNDRNPFYASWSGQWAMIGFWMGGCLNLGTFATGFLGWELGLDLQQSIQVIVFGTAAGAVVTSWCATMGAPTGLRQVSICRYSLGWYPSKVIAILNVIQQIGWCASGSIAGGQALSAFSDGKVGTQVGVVICSVMSLVFSFLGLKAVYQYVKYAWVVFLVVFLIMLGEVAKYGDLATPPSARGVTGSGAALTFFGIMYGASACCAGYVSDFYVEYPANTSKVTVFLLTFLGLFISTCICGGAGAVAASALPNNKLWEEQYNIGVGFLIQAMIYPYGLAKLTLFLLMFMAISLNSASMYSAALSIQLSARALAVVPRFIWTLLCFGAIVVLSVAGSDRLLVFLQDFLSLLGYYATAVFVCLVSEHYLFRRGSFNNYNLEAWNKPEMLPLGYAGGPAFICGIIGAVLGMSTTWYTGVVAKLIGDLGGDIGNELCFLLTLFVYVPARFVEIRLVAK